MKLESYIIKDLVGVQAIKPSFDQLVYPIDAACRYQWGLDVIEIMLEAGAAEQLLTKKVGSKVLDREFPFLAAAKHGNIETRKRR